MNTKKAQARLPLIIIIAVAILASIGLFRRCHESNSTLANDYIRPTGDTLAVAIEMSRLTYSLHNDTASGFDYEMLRDMAKEHGVPVKFEPVSDLASAFAGLNRGEYDLVVASFPSTRALKELFPVTEPVYIDRQVLVQRVGKDSLPPINSQEQLMHDTVWIAEGSPVQTRLRNLAKELGDTITIVSPKGYSAEQLAIATALGEVKHSVLSERAAKRVKDVYPDLDISTPISFDQFQCWAAAPGDSALVDTLNNWMNSFKTTAVYDSLAKKYLQ